MQVRHMMRGRLFSTTTRYRTAAVPVIDLGPLTNLRPGEAPPAALVDEVAAACEKWGFFQVVNHGVDKGLMARASAAQHDFFSLPAATKEAMRRSADNSRGWYDDELTKQRRDWKEGLDFGSTPPMDWALRDEDVVNGTLDGYNRFPSEAALPGFRATALAYYDALTGVAERLARVFSLGLGMPADFFEPTLRRTQHTSYLRFNYYSPYTGFDPSQLCISPHKDAGFLTVLQQDETCHSLQVPARTLLRFLLAPSHPRPRTHALAPTPSHPRPRTHTLPAPLTSKPASFRCATASVPASG